MLWDISHFLLSYLYIVVIWEREGKFHASALLEYLWRAGCLSQGFAGALALAKLTCTHMREGEGGCFILQFTLHFTFFRTLFPLATTVCSAWCLVGWCLLKFLSWNWPRPTQWSACTKTITSSKTCSSPWPTSRSPCLCLTKKWRYRLHHIALHSSNCVLKVIVAMSTNQISMERHAIFQGNWMIKR